MKMSRETNINRETTEELAIRLGDKFMATAFRVLLMLPTSLRF